MSASEIERFNADVQASEEMQKELVEAGSGIGSVVEFANARGYDFSAGDVQDYIEANTGEALSDEQLDAISGAGTGAVNTHTSVNTNTNVNTTTEVSIEVATQHVVVVAGYITIFSV